MKEIRLRPCEDTRSARIGAALDGRSLTTVRVEETALSWNPLARAASIDGERSDKRARRGCRRCLWLVNAAACTKYTRRVWAPRRIRSCAPVVPFSRSLDAM